ncbi:MAG: hypothetical protein FWE44_07295 [Defluviitaleaceae bacterium]|nr:hypothetical protein [Defluviitaleaceae bacterium]
MRERLFLLYNILLAKATLLIAREWTIALIKVCSNGPLVGAAFCRLLELMLCQIRLQSESMAGGKMPPLRFYQCKLSTSNRTPNFRRLVHCSFITKFLNFRKSLYFF